MKVTHKQMKTYPFVANPLPLQALQLGSGALVNFMISYQSEHCTPSEKHNTIHFHPKRELIVVRLLHKKHKLSVVVCEREEDSCRSEKNLHFGTDCVVTCSYDYLNSCCVGY